MDCIQSIQSAIAYIEEHMLEPINYEDVARYLHMSSYHFHRTFSMVTGITANEYIRNRKLSMAGQELILSDKKVIDVALKYGYESPESFAKAFSRFHGVTPNVARRSGTRMRSYNRLILRIKLEGGTMIDYKIVEREKFSLLVKAQAFRNESISEEGNTEIPDFWKQCGADGVFEVLKQHTKTLDTYGVCAPISKESTHFDYGVGMRYEGGAVPEGFRVWEMTSTLWAVFPCIGEDGSCIGETWERIFKEFLPNSQYNMIDAADFELYPQNSNLDCFCEIWVPVEKRDGGTFDD